MTTLQRCVEFLNQNRVSYAHTTHPNAYKARELASAEHLAPYQVAKTVIFCGDDCYAMAVLPADCEIDAGDLAHSLGLRRVRLATEAELARLFPESELGAMPPLGKLFNLPVYVDERLAAEKYIVFSAGTHHDAIHMSYADFYRLAEPLVVRFAQPEARVT